jgi:hypothetical protein
MVNNQNSVCVGESDLSAVHKMSRGRHEVFVGRCKAHDLVESAESRRGVDKLDSLESLLPTDRELVYETVAKQTTYAGKVLVVAKAKQTERTFSARPSNPRCANGRLHASRVGVPRTTYEPRDVSVPNVRIYLTKWGGVRTTTRLGPTTRTTKQQL